MVSACHHPNQQHPELEQPGLLQVVIELQEISPYGRILRMQSSASSVARDIRRNRKRSNAERNRLRQSELGGAF